MSGFKDTARRTPALAAGFGLIELMIALVLGLLVIGAAFAVFQSNQATYRANEGLNRIQESARIAFELMSRDIRSAGGGPCSNASRVVTTDADQSLRFQNAPISGTGAQLTTVSGDDASYRITAATASSVTLDTRDIPASRVGEVFEAGDWLLLCNASRTALVTITGVAGSVVSYNPTFNPLDDSFVSPTTAGAARLRNVTWSAGPNGRGGNSLFVTRFGTQEEVAEDVQSLAITYLVDGAASYVAAPPAGAAITAVRINMVLSGQDIDGNPLTRTASNVVSLRSRTP